MLLTEFSKYQRRVSAIRARTRDTVLSPATAAELQNAVNYRIDLGTTWTGEAIAGALGSVTDEAQRERVRADLAAARSQADVAEVMARYGLSNWATNATGVAHTDRSLAHLDRDGAAGVSTLRAMNRAARAHWNR